eukprot:SAG22_NODE_3000_length_2037_cov_2.101651_2_plen_176_part_00
MVLSGAPIALQQVLRFCSTLAGKTASIDSAANAPAASTRSSGGQAQRAAPPRGRRPFARGRAGGAGVDPQLGPRAPVRVLDDFELVSWQECKSNNDLHAGAPIGPLGHWHSTMHAYYFIAIVWHTVWPCTQDCWHQQLRMQIFRLYVYTGRSHEHTRLEGRRWSFDYRESLVSQA